MSEPAVENRLPHNADLTQLKLQARELQRAFAAGEAGARALVARHLPHRPQPARLALADAQCTIARGYGFASWPGLKAHVQWLRSSDEQRLEAAASAVNPHGFTELDAERYEESLETVRSMLRYDPALVHRRFGERQRTLLHQAAWGNGLKLTELLLAGGADPHARDSGGATPLSVALDFGFGREPLAARLAGLGPVPDNLRVAAGIGRLERARELLADADRPDAQARQGLWRGNDFVERPLAPTRQALLDDALAYAARSAQLEMTTWLLEQGANVNARPHGGTALHWAAFLGRAESVRLLLDRGADVTILDEGNGGTALNWAHIFGAGDLAGPYDEVAELLLRHRTPAGLSLLCAYASAERIRETLSKPGVDVDQPDFTGTSGLVHAVRRGRDDIALILLEHGANPDRPDPAGNTPRSIAGRAGRSQILHRMT
jgi:ankyrin repeat protein